MTSVNFQQWIQHPETLNRDTLYELRNLLARYPYFQSLRLLYLKNLYILHDISFGARTAESGSVHSRRRKLFQLIEGDRFAVQSRKKQDNPTEVLKDEPSVDRTLALIDAFCLQYPKRCCRGVSTIVMDLHFFLVGRQYEQPSDENSLRS